MICPKIEQKKKKWNGRKQNYLIGDFVSKDVMYQDSWTQEWEKMESSSSAMNGKHEVTISKLVI
jgi:hypothetical protein